MVHHRQRLALGFEARDDGLGVHAQLDDLECDTAADRLLLFGHIHHATAALANFLAQLVTINDVASLFGDRNKHALGQAMSGRALQEGIVHVAAGQQFHDPMAQRDILAAGPFDVGGEGLGIGQFKGALKNLLRPAVTFSLLGIHLIWCLPCHAAGPASARQFFDFPKVACEWHRAARRG